MFFPICQAAKIAAQKAQNEEVSPCSINLFPLSILMFRIHTKKSFSTYMGAREKGGGGNYGSFFCSHAVCDRLGRVYWSLTNWLSYCINFHYFGYMYTGLKGGRGEGGGGGRGREGEGRSLGEGWLWLCLYTTFDLV